MAPNLEALDQRVTALEKLIAEIRAQAARGQPLDAHLPRLEQLVADLRAQIGVNPPRWYERFAVTDAEAFEEAMRLGREFRRTGRLSDDADPQP